MKIEKREEVIKTELVTIEMTAEEAFTLWEILGYVTSEWHLVHNTSTSYKVEATEYAKKFLTEIEHGLEDNMNTSSPVPDTTRLYRGV